MDVLNSLLELKAHHARLAFVNFAAKLELFGYLDFLGLGEDKMHSAKAGLLVSLKIIYPAHYNVNYCVSGNAKRLHVSIYTP